MPHPIDQTSLSGSINPDLSLCLPIIIQQHRQILSLHYGIKRKARQFYQNHRADLENLSCFDRNPKGGALPCTPFAIGGCIFCPRGCRGCISLQIHFECSGTRRDVVLFDSNYRTEMMEKVCRQRSSGIVLLNGDNVSENLSRLDIIKISV